jgi:hypothetical protein
MSKTPDNGLKRAEKTRSNRLNLSDFLCLTPFSAIFPVFVNYKKAALDSQPQMLRLTNCLPMVGGSLRVLQLLAHLRRVAMI